MFVVIQPFMYGQARDVVRLLVRVLGLGLGAIRVRLLVRVRVLGLGQRRGAPPG